MHLTVATLPVVAPPPHGVPLCHQIDPSRTETIMYIGGGVLVTVLIILAIIFLAKRV
jgi:hypothetical protein